MKKWHSVCAPINLIVLAFSLLPATASAKSPKGRFVINPSGQTVYDAATGLTWTRDVSSYGPPANKAQTYCDQLPIDGGGWKVPTLRQLQTILDPNLVHPAYDTAVFAFPPPQEVGYMQLVTSTTVTYPNGDLMYWVLRFWTGEAIPFSKTTYSLVRCVRK